MKSSTQNNKITSLTEKTLIIGIDVGSDKHYARAFDNRFIEYTKPRKPFVFNNDEQGFRDFLIWADEMAHSHGKDVITVGMEPTGHYWINLGTYIEDHGMKIVHVNPHHVNKAKELDDNNPSKNDRKDPKVIAGLVSEGRYNYPYIPRGIYAEIRSLSNLRFQAQEELTRAKNRLARWFAIYFPNYKDVYGSIGAVSGIMILKAAPLPADIVKLGADGINQIWRAAKLKGAGPARAKRLYDAAVHTVGSHEAPEAARIELLQLLDDYEVYFNREAGIMERVKEKVFTIPYVDKLLQISGVGIKTVIGFIAETGDLSRFNNAGQLQKLAGLAIVSTSSGKHKGESHISYRGRKHLRYIMYEAAISVIRNNRAFKEIHEYYTTRPQNPQKKMQSVITIACKLIRVFFALLTKGTDFDMSKLLSDIHRVEPAAA